MITAIEAAIMADANTDGKSLVEKCVDFVNLAVIDSASKGDKKCVCQLIGIKHDEIIQTLQVLNEKGYAALYESKEQAFFITWENAKSSEK